MSQTIDSAVIVGGGTAGWLTAAVLAAARPDVAVTLVEAPDIAPLGVGEGSWPTLRDTLRRIGIDEADFLRRCDASFKQGSRFVGWRKGAAHAYLHPFTPPPAGDLAGLLGAWSAQAAPQPFAAAMTAQTAVCAGDLAPRQRGMPPYAGALNYGYHLDAGKFAALLRDRATGALGVRHVTGRVAAAAGRADRIEALLLDDSRRIEGDLFVDCSGAAGLLIEGHCRADWIDRSAVSFNDRALAVQIATLPESPIASQTDATAHAAGWLWDIALPGRRGIGCVYASRFASDSEAEDALAAYAARVLPGHALPAPRRLAFRTGYRAAPFTGNCVAIGQAAGFIEPLEASAIVMIELAARALADNFPRTAASLPHHAARFNAQARYRWERIVDFLKLHYVLSDRDEPYWQAHRAPASIPERLAGQLELWRDQPPSAWDFPMAEEVFSAASQAYVLYGMGFPLPRAATGAVLPPCAAALAETAARARALTAALPANRTYFNAVAAPAAHLGARP